MSRVFRNTYTTNFTVFYMESNWTNCSVCNFVTRYKFLILEKKKKKNISKTKINFKVSCYINMLSTKPFLNSFTSSIPVCSRKLLSQAGAPRHLLGIWNTYKKNLKLKKTPAYNRHWISQPMQIITFFVIFGGQTNYFF